MISRQFLLFLIAGGLAACVNFGSRIALSQWLHYTPAIIIAYCLGMTTAFLLNRAFVFRSAANRMRSQAFWFIVVNLAAVLQTLAISLLLARWLLPQLGIDFHNETLAHAVGVAVPVLTSYFGHKYLSFRQKN
ncbi:GtrA family protein [Stenotrophomonas sp. FSL W7-1447]|uniref:GtrA family protein n=1 Tax=Stenotrophomonas TaxID=40323 RepID=UPI0030CFEC02